MKLLLAAMLLTATPALARDVLVPSVPAGTYNGPRALELRLPWWGLGLTVELARDLRAGDCVRLDWFSQHTYLRWQDYPAIGLSARAATGTGMCQRVILP